MLNILIFGGPEDREGRWTAKHCLASWKRRGLAQLENAGRCGLPVLVRCRVAIFGRRNLASVRGDAVAFIRTGRVTPLNLVGPALGAPDTRFRLASMTPIKRAAASPRVSKSFRGLLLMCGNVARGTSEMSEKPSEKSEMSSVEFVSDALRRRVAPPSVGAVKARIRHAARQLGWSYTRTKDAWYADPRIAIRHEEDDDSYCMTPREIAATVAFWLLLACAALFVLAWYFFVSTAGA